MVDDPPGLSKDEAAPVEPVDATVTPRYAGFPTFARLPDLESRRTVEHSKRPDWRRQSPGAQVVRRARGAISASGELSC